MVVNNAFARFLETVAIPFSQFNDEELGRISLTDLEGKKFGNFIRFCDWRRHPEGRYGGDSKIVERLSHDVCIILTW